MPSAILKLIFPAFLLFFLFSCKNREGDSYRTRTPDSVSTVMREVVSTLNADNGKTCQIDNCDNVLIIPIDEGCESCLQKAVSFSLTTSRKNLLVIISSSSKKVFMQKIKEYTSSDNALSVARNSILVDSVNLCFKKGLSDIMPRIYRIKEGKTENQIMLDASDIEEELKSL